MASSATEDTRSAIAKKKMIEGNGFYKMKRYAKALECFSEAITLFPDTVEYYGNRCMCLMMMSRFKLAKEDAQKCINLNPSFVKAYVREAKCNIVLGLLNEARGNFENIKRLDPCNYNLPRMLEYVDRIHTFINKYKTAVATNDHKSALCYVNNALEIAAYSDEYKLLKAESLVTLCRHKDAHKILADLIRLDQTNADALSVYGTSFYYQYEFDKAFTYFQRALRLSPLHEKTHAVYEKAKRLQAKKKEGDAACNNNNLAEAFNIYTAALQVDPLNVVTNAKMRKVKEAINDCTSAIRLDEKYLKAYLRRAKLYSDVEMYEESVQDYNKVYQTEKTQEYYTLLRKAKSHKKRTKRYYTILGLTKLATGDEIRKTYRKLAMLHHPDRHVGASDQVQREEEKKFKEIKEAYSVLSDANKRLWYDN